VNPILEADVDVGYGKLTVARDIELRLRPNEVTAVLGPNGAGKTTLMMTLAGFLSPTRGEIRIDGEPVKAGSARRMSKAGVVLVPDRRALFTQLTTMENLKLAARRGGPAVDEVLDLFTVLRDRLQVKAGALSGGEQQMLAVARALMSRPKLLLLDEPSLGLAPMIVQDLFARFHRINEETGTTMLVVEQNAQLALSIANRGYVLESGHISLQGSADELLHDDAIRKAYLGV
jgi:branched-chain amino acid transport system ATP-binding protein